jgi:hypothetical protein
MTMPNYNMTLLFVLLGLTPACNIGDKNLGESGDVAEDETTDPGPDLPAEGDGDGDEGDGDGDEEGDGDGESTTCGDGVEDPTELCFEPFLSLPLPGPALDVVIYDVDAAGENALMDIVALTSAPGMPLVIWHNDEGVRFQTEAEIVAGPLPTATIPGLATGDFDPFGTEYIDIAYASADGIVIGWDKGLGDDAAFNEVTLAVPCANPSSFVAGSFDDVSNGPDLLCAHQVGDTIELVVASNLGDRDFSAPTVIGVEPAITRLRNRGDRIVAHDGVDQLLVWDLIGESFVQSSQTVPGAVWDLGFPYLPGDIDWVLASHDPQGLLTLDENEGELEVGELLATDATPYATRSANITYDDHPELIVALGSGHLGVWLGNEAGLEDELVTIEVGPDPRELDVERFYDWSEELDEGSPVIVVTTGESISVLYANP